MELDKYQQAWRSDTARLRVSIDTDSLTKEMQRSRQAFRSTIFWRDVRELGIGLLMIPIWIYLGIAMALPWTWYLEIPASIWVMGFTMLDRRRHQQRTGHPSESLLHCSKESLRQVEHQIWLLRNVFWWYLLPYTVAIMAFFVHVSWQASSVWWEFFATVGGFGLLTLVVYGVTYLVNQGVVRLQLEPRRQELLHLVASLEVESDGTDSKDIIDLVSKLADPTRSFTWESWADNWNRTVPSWLVAASILFPTLFGACCGLYSGLWIRIPEMGPVFFQTVIGAVIPFEIAFFSNMYLAYRRKKKRQAASANGEQNMPASGVVLEQSEKHKTKLLPEPPALVILVLTLFVGIMAILAIVSVFLYLGSERLLSRNNSPIEPSFGDVSGFGDDDTVRIDSWLQEQVDLAKYPSLAVAIVRDGEIVYGRAFGFEDIKSSKLATRQTQYNVASVTKVFTASLAVMLHEQGVVDLDQPVAKYLAESVVISNSPKVGATITLRQLASHTSGLPRGVPGRVQSVEGWYALEPQRLYDHLATVKLESEPGTKELYSNLGFGLLGHALERAANKSLDQLVKEKICEPLKLERTAIQVDDTVHPATGYDDSGRQREKKAPFRDRLAGSGGLVASVEDLAKFLSAQMDPGVFSRKMLDDLYTRSSRSDGVLVDTGLGWSINFNKYLGSYAEKNGGRSNCSAWIGFSPEHSVGVVVVTNCGGPEVDAIGRLLLERSVQGAYKPVQKDNQQKRVTDDKIERVFY
ncbi:MAG: serine hydrolase domain-containing protein [Pirellula sp.]